MTFVMQIIALKFVKFREVGVDVVPGFYDLICSYMEAIVSQRQFDCFSG